MMDQEEQLFYKIRDQLIGMNPSVTGGKMMSSQAIKYKNKVLAFYHKKEMVFKLGKDFNAVAYGLKDYQLLNPFKKKGPMKGWFQVAFSEQQKWEDLACYALSHLSKEIDSK